MTTHSLDVRPRYEDNPEEDVAIGLDLQGHRVRVVSAFPSSRGEITLYDRACHSSREGFQRYWQRLLHPHWHAHVAVAGDSDPLGILPWLTRMSIYPDWLPVFEAEPGEKLAKLGLPKTYARAYDLCVTVCSRIQEHSVRAELWRKCQRLQNELSQVTMDLGRLASPPSWRGDLAMAPLPPPPTAFDDRPPRPIDEIPF